MIALALIVLKKLLTALNKKLEWKVISFLIVIIDLLLSVFSLLLKGIKWTLKKSFSFSVFVAEIVLSSKKLEEAFEKSLDGLAVSFQFVSLALTVFVIALNF